MTKKFPIGWRTTKTLIAVYLCFIISILRGEGIVFYSAIAAILVMQKNVSDAKRVALNRVLGTFIGGFYAAIAVLLFNDWGLEYFGYLHYLIITLFILCVIYTNVFFKIPGSVYISCVVFLSISVAHGADANPLLFSVHRVLDTLIGIGVSLGVNLILPGNTKEK